MRTPNSNRGNRDSYSDYIFSSRCSGVSAAQVARQLRPESFGHPGARVDLVSVQIGGTRRTVAAVNDSERRHGPILAALFVSCLFFGLLVIALSVRNVLAVSKDHSVSIPEQSAMFVGKHDLVAVEPVSMNEKDELTQAREGLQEVYLEEVAIGHDPVKAGAGLAAVIGQGTRYSIVVDGQSYSVLVRDKQERASSSEVADETALDLSRYDRDSHMLKMPPQLKIAGEGGNFVYGKSPREVLFKINKLRSTN